MKKAKTPAEPPATSTGKTTRRCDCGCGSEFPIPPDAPHKRFASTECRNRWHRQRRERAKQKPKAAAMPEDL